MNKETWIQVIKIGLGSALAFYIASLLKLDYATSTGIVTLLTIVNTRKDTFHLALKRIISFMVTIGLAALCVSFIPLKVLAFAAFMLVMVTISYYLNWNAAISVNAVIGTHVILTEGQISWALVLNEAGIVLIGIAIAILFNMRMPDKEKELQMDIAHIDAYMSDNLHHIASHLCNHSKLNKDRQHLKNLLDHISKAIDKAYANKNNTLRSHSEYYINYLNLRKEQCEILLHIYYIVAHHDFVVEEAAIVAEEIREVVKHLNVQNEIGAIKHNIDKVAQGILQGEMPKSHEEFEGKAVLYQLLYELREFLWHQEMFVSDVTEEQVLAYWE